MMGLVTGLINLSNYEVRDSKSTDDEMHFQVDAPDPIACEKCGVQGEIALPVAVRNDIWRAFRPGQEITKTPGANWWAAYAAAVEAWGFPEQAQRYRALVIRAERRDSALRAIELENAIAAADDDGWSDE